MFTSFFAGLAKFIKDTFYEIEIDIEVTPSDSFSASVQLQVEAAEYLYSQRWDRWFHYSEVCPLECTWGEDEAALTPDGLILFAFECVWGDGLAVSDVEIPSEKAARRIFNYDTAETRNNLAFEMGY